MAEYMKSQRPKPSQIQLNEFLYKTMLAQQRPQSGWQNGVAIQERMIKCHNLITNIDLAVTNIEFMKAAEVGVNFEREAFNKSADKTQYDAQMSNKTNEFFRRRQPNEQAKRASEQHQMAAVNQKEMDMQQPQRLAQGPLTRLPSNIQPKASMSSCVSIHPTISRDNTSSQDARNASLFADLGMRLNSCPRKSSSNTPERESGKSPKP